MNTKDKTFNMSKRWFAKITDLRAKYPLLVLVRDNSRENSSKEMISARVGRAAARNVLCCGFDSCRRRPRGVTLD
jgi:hypothetical protein